MVKEERRGVAGKLGRKRGSERVLKLESNLL